MNIKYLITSVIYIAAIIWEGQWILHLEFEEQNI